MDNKIKSAIKNILALAATSTLVVATTAIANQPSEKCYGITKTGLNDCQTATASCAGSSVKDKQGDAFIFLPKGLCNKIVDGSLTPKTNEKIK